jgi:hydroxyacylglutathione hydrolase
MRPTTGEAPFRENVFCERKLVMEVISIKPFGDFSNCYIIKDETGTAAVVDPGCVTDELISELDKCTKVEYILLTHGHYDHIWAVSGLKEKTGAKLVIHRGDEAFLTDENLSHGVKYFPGEQKPLKADILLQGGETLPLGNGEIRVMHTPGHTKGSVVYIAGDTMCSGDTLFCMTVGRTDLEGGSMHDMISTLERLKALKGDYKVLPGHGRDTTLEAERQRNRYMSKIERLKQQYGYKG